LRSKHVTRKLGDGPSVLLDNESVMCVHGYQSGSVMCVCNYQSLTFMSPHSRMLRLQFCHLLKVGLFC